MSEKEKEVTKIRATPGPEQACESCGLKSNKKNWKFDVLAKKRLCDPCFKNRSLGSPVSATPSKPTAVPPAPVAPTKPVVVPPVTK